MKTYEGSLLVREDCRAGTTGESAVFPKASSRSYVSRGEETDVSKPSLSQGFFFVKDSHIHGLCGETRNSTQAYQSQTSLFVFIFL